MKQSVVGVLAAVVLLLAESAVNAQPRLAAYAPMAGAQAIEVLDAQPLETMAPVKDAPFTADAITEFTQVLADGNRIERSFKASLARDSHGRTRREQEIALIGPLARLDDQPPRIVTITDPEANVHFTLDERMKTAFKGSPGVHVAAAAGMRAMVTSELAVQGGPAVAGPSVDVRRFGDPNGVGRVDMITRGGGHHLEVTSPIAGQVISAMPFEAAAAAPHVVSQSLGSNVIEGVTAEGTRTTMTIPVGAVGNVGPIEVVSERWFSSELQMVVQMTRRDPRSGETVYRLTNIVRAEPPPYLFVVPSDYQVQEPQTFIIEKGRERPKPVPAR